VALCFLHDLFVDPLGKELGVRDALPASETFEQENVLRIKPDGDRLAGGPTQLEHLGSVELSSRLSFGFPGRCPIPITASFRSIWMILSGSLEVFIPRPFMMGGASSAPASRPTRVQSREK
jgi:hypothetical protein